MSSCLGSTLEYELAFMENEVKFKAVKRLLIFCSELSSCLNVKAIFLMLFCMDLKLRLSHEGEHTDHVCLSAITEEST
jgi:hypothetical protein